MAGGERPRLAGGASGSLPHNFVTLNEIGLRGSLRAH